MVGAMAPRVEVAVILAAGVGSRLRPLTDDRPKALVEVGGESIIGRAIRLLHAHGVREVIVATGYEADALVRALTPASVRVRFCPNPRYGATQNSVSLALCATLVEGRPFYKLDGDLIFQADVLERLDESSAELSIAVDCSRMLDDEAMKVRLGEGQDVRELSKEIPLAEAAGESIGIERIGAKAVAPLFRALGRALEAGVTDRYYEHFYGELIAEGTRARAVDVSDLPWCEVDTMDDLERARAMLSA
jgi:choline kinase